MDTGFFHPDGRRPEGYFLIVSALVPYKRIDVAIDAARRVGRPLRIVGEGPERMALEARAAGADVEFLGYQPDEAVRELYRGADAVVLPGEEDFGIVPVEAQACGRPVVALARGGALETVEDGRSGLLVADPGPEALADALAAVGRQSFDPAEIRARAERFGRDRFAGAMRHLIDETLEAPAGTRW